VKDYIHYPALGKLNISKRNDPGTMGPQDNSFERKTETKELRTSVAKETSRNSSVMRKKAWVREHTKAADSPGKSQEQEENWKRRGSHPKRKMRIVSIRE